MLEVVFIVHAANQRHRLIPRPERPVRLDSFEESIEFDQRSRVACLRVRRGLSRMAGRTNTGTNEMLARSYPGQRE